MAKSKKKPEAESVSAWPSRRLEAVGVLVLLLTVALSFALFSFDPNDSGGANLVGPVGLRVARLILGSIGVVGYLASLVGFGLLGAIFLGWTRVPSVLRILSTGAILVGATIFAHLVTGDATVLGHAAGGTLGQTLGEGLRGVVGPAGAALVAMAAVLLGILGASQVSVAHALAEGGAWALLLLKGVWGRFQVYREARAAEAQRETELLEAMRSRQAQTKLEREAKEQELRDKLEEKQRLAVLKATARAEERVAKRLAEQELDATESEPTEPPIATEAEPAAEPKRKKKKAAPEPQVAEPTPEPKVEPEVSQVPVVVEAAPAPQVEADATEAEADDGDDDDDDDDDDQPLEDAATVLERIARQTQQNSGPAESADELVIHERKHVEVSFEEDLEPPPQKPIYELPPINLLDHEGEAPQPVDGELLRGKATRLEEKLRTYGVEGKVVAIRPGPVVTTYEYQPAPGVKVSKIANLSDDIAMSMEAVRVRIVAPIPGRGVVGIELPNDRRENVYLKELIAHDAFKKGKSLLTLAMGKDAEGEVQVRDLRKMPHLLIAGTTGSGKSVSINTMVLSVLYKATPEQVKFIMVDPKMLELSLYNDIPHLLLPVVTDPRKASLALQWAVDEMERRYQMLSDMKVRDLEGFNRRLEKLREQRLRDAEDARRATEIEDELESEALDTDSEVNAEIEAPEAPSERPGVRVHDPFRGQDLPDNLPYIVVLIDEFADLMCVAPKDVEASVQRLAQKARAAGIHVLLATQRPSTDVITGVIKNNFPCRVSFRVASRHDSATVLNAPGAESLLGMGDSLYLSVAAPNPERIHAGYVSEDEVERVVEFWKKQAKPKYDPTILAKRDSDEEGAGIEPEEIDENYDMAVKIVTETKKASISALQRRLRVGYNRAARMIEMMEVQGIVGPAMGPKGEREVLVRAMGPDGPERN